MGFFNRGGGASGETAREGDTVIGVTSRLHGNKGTVIKVTTRLGDDELTVKWTKGPRSGKTEVVAQWEVGGTLM